TRMQLTATLKERLGTRAFEVQVEANLQVYSCERKITWNLKLIPRCCALAQSPMTRCELDNPPNRGCYNAYCNTAMAVLNMVNPVPINQSEPATPESKDAPVPIKKRAHLKREHPTLHKAASSDSKKMKEETLLDQADSLLTKNE
ncbi:hypothetical protein, partial [Litorimonas sp.]|uniref:hypothetical protein n=1 Tax=Litorimonas sp. TaxID=1892381 RepID=UPI003A8581E8